MFTMLLLILSAGFDPVWNPFPEEKELLSRFKKELSGLPDEMKPDGDQSVACAWALYCQRTAELVLKADAHFNVTPLPKTMKMQKESRDYVNDKCGGPGSPLMKKIKSAIDMMESKRRGMGQAREATAPFQLPLLPDRAGEDLGGPLWTMFATLEGHLAKGGHPLAGEARACAWATAALAAASAVQRSPGATEGIGAGAKVLDARVATHCQGDALRAKDAAWAWLRANPAATQPLVVPYRAPAPAWPAPTPADGALWLSTVLLFLGPEAWPAILITAPAK